MTKKITVVIPAYKVAAHIIQVVQAIGKQVSEIIVVDDKCPQNSGLLVKRKIKDKRVKVLFNSENLGVGGSMIVGYKVALRNNPAFVVKIDGDGQMNPNLIPIFIKELQKTGADYAKGNRFSDPENLKLMPTLRILGNLVLSFFAKFSTGYWNIFDPNNGFTLIKGEMLKRIPLDKVSSGYFFESDMLFRLNLIGAHVVDVPMKPVYGDELSNLKIGKSLFEFTFKHSKNFYKRIAYNYFLRDFNLASLQLFFAIIFLMLGIFVGGFNLNKAIQTNTSMSVGFLVLVSILVVSGLQLLLNFFNFDMSIRNQR